MSSLNNLFSSLPSNTTAIEDKDNEKNDKTTDDDWKSFAYTIPTNLLHTLFFVLIGASLIFYKAINNNKLPEDTKTDKTPEGATALYKFFPYDPATYFEKPVPCSDTKLKDSNTPSYKCGEVQIPASICRSAEKFAIGGGTPYIYGDGEDGTVNFSIQGLINWFTLSQAGTWANYRSLLGSVVTLLSEQSDTVQIILGGILMYLFITIVLGTVFPGMIINIINQITSKGGDDETLWSPLLYTFIPGMFMWMPNAIVLLFNTIFVVTLFPLFVSPNTIKDILVCNHKIVGLIFGFMMATSASLKLDTTIAGSMWGTWFVLLCLWFWKG